MSGFQAPLKKKIALDNTKLTLSAKCPTAEGKTSKLYWGLNKNNPYIRVYTGDPADENERTKNGRIQAEIDLPHLYSILEFIRQAAVAENGWKVNIGCENYIYPGGKRSEKPVNTADIWVGKDKDGVVYISLIDKLIKDRPIIKFDIAFPGYWINVKHADGRPYSKAEGSSIFARSYADLLQDAYGFLHVTEYAHPQPAADKGGNRGGGYSRGGNSGGYNNNQSSGGTNASGGDDEMPF